MSANKIDRSLLTDPRALAQFQQTRQTEAGDGTVRKPEGTKQDEQTIIPDGERLEISTSAHKLAQMRELLDAGRARLTEEEPVRREKIEVVKRRLQSGVYASTEVRDQVADRLAGLMRGLDTLLE
jgi:hypothetical protein